MAAYNFTSWLVGMVFVAVILAVTWTDGKHWPDLSCHPSYNDSHRDSSVLVCKDVEQNCIRAQKKYTGICVKLCQLKWHRWLSHEDGWFGGPVSFNIHSIMTDFSQELGYWDGLGGEAAKTLKDKVRKGMEECAKNHKKELAHLRLNSTTCDEGEPIFSCIDRAIGC